MDVTYGLISNFVKCKSVDRVLAPIASQVSLLIILDEGLSSQRDHGEGETTPSQISSCASCVSKAVESLISVARKQTENAQQTGFKQDMSSACEILDLARSSFYVAAQKFQANPASRQIRSALVQSAKDVLQGILKVLLVSDESEVKRIISVVEETKGKVLNVGNVTNMKDMVSAFKSLTDTVMVLISLTTRRQKDLINPSHREQLITSVTVLRKSLSGLNTAMQTYLKYRHNPQAHAGKESMIEQIFSTLEVIQETLKSKQTREATLNVEEPGYFVSRMNCLLDCLSEEERTKLHPDMETWTAGVVRHSMAVAHLCSEDYRDVIIKHCQNVLQLKGQMLTLTASLKHSSPDSHTRTEQGRICEVMSDRLCELEESVNMALLYLMVDVFKESVQPLERLLKTALAPQKSDSDFKNVGLVISEFSDHADRVYQVASLAAASSTDSKRVRVIRAAVYHLENLDPDIIPSIQTVAKQPDNMAALRHLKLLVKDWKAELFALVEVMDEMVDPELFIEVSERKIAEDISAVRGFILEMDQQGASEAIGCVFCRTKRVGQIASSVVDHSADAIFRNGLLVFIKKLQQAESITKEALKYLYRDFFNPGLQETCLKHLNLLIGFVGQVRAGLCADNHPDILSPERMMVYKKRRPQILSGSKLHKQGKPKSTSGISLYKHASNVDLEPTRHKMSNRHQTPESKLEKQKHDAVKPESSLEPIQSSVLEPIQSQILEPIQSSVLEPIQSSSSLNRVNLGVKMSDIHLLARQFVSAAVAGDKQRVNVLTSDLLGWTNHIVDAAVNLTNHCSDLEHTEDIQNLCREAESLAPQTINTAKYVAAGDISEVATLQHTADTWAQKLDKARIRLDVAVETWKDLADEVLNAIQKGCLEKLKTEIAILESHKDALCILLDQSKSLQCGCVKEVELTLTFLKEQQDDLENLTITIKTTADLTLQTGNATDISLYRGQLSQLCREWAVTVTCIFGALRTLYSHIRQTGKENVRILKETTLEVSDVSRLIVKKDKMMEMLKSVCTRNDNLESKCSSMCDVLDSCIEELQSSEIKIFNNIPDPSVYITHHRHLLLSQWILTMLEGDELIQQETSDLCQALDMLHNQAVDIHRLSLTDPASFPKHKSEYLCEVSKMAANFTMLQQKVLNAIQLSPDLAMRTVVRHCLDDISILSPQLLDKMKTFAEDNSPDDLELEWCDLKTDWAAELRKLLLILQQMPDVRPTLSSEVIKLLTLEGRKKYSPKKSAKWKTNEMSDDMKTTPAKQFLPQTPLSAVRFKGNNSALGTPTNKPFRSIMTSACYLEDVSRQWQDTDNQVISVAMSIVNHTKNIAEYCRGTGEIEDVSGLIAASESIVEHARQMQKYIKTLADSCIEESHAKDLRVCVDKIASFTTQLNIITNVLQNSPTTAEGEKIVLRNASNLLQAVEEAFHEAESVCIKGLVEIEEEDDGESAEIIRLVHEWQKKLTIQRSAEASMAPKDELGLRRIECHNPPSLVHILH